MSAPAADDSSTLLLVLLAFVLFGGASRKRTVADVAKPAPNTNTTEATVKQIATGARTINEVVQAGADLLRSIRNSLDSGSADDDSRIYDYTTGGTRENVVGDTALAGDYVDDGHTPDNQWLQGLDDDQEALA